MSANDVGARPVPKVVLSYGLGVDSTAILLRWLHEPATRPCALDDLLIITAMTGDEWPTTGRLVETHILPLLYSHKIRYLQVARAGPCRGDGITILDDSREPTRLHLAGRYRLQDEMIAAGTVPQTGGARLCSAKAKGWALDHVINSATAAQPFLHVMGFEVHEQRRANRDTAYNTQRRTGVYPLIEWGWDRNACERYIHDQLGTTWHKSACRYCPYSFMSQAGRNIVLADYAADPQAALDGLIMERIAVSLNPAQGLIGGRRLEDLLRSCSAEHPALVMLEVHLDSRGWAIYEVRRVLRPRNNDPARLGHAARSVRILATGTRPAMTAELRQLAADCGLTVDAGDGIARIWLRRRGPTLPTVEWFWVAAPSGPIAKDGPGFAAAWSASIPSLATTPAATERAHPRPALQQLGLGSTSDTAAGR